MLDSASQLDLHTDEAVSDRITEYFRSLQRSQLSIPHQPITYESRPWVAGATLSLCGSKGHLRRYFAGTSPALTKAWMQALDRTLRLLSKHRRNIVLPGL